MNERKCENVGRAARGLFEDGLHCAEAVAGAALGMLERDAAEAVCCATGFGAGVGRTTGEMCGALAGAVVAIGFLHGRSTPAKDWEYVAALSAELRLRFLQRHGATVCGELRRGFREGEQMQECGKIVAETAADLLVILAADGRQGRPIAENCRQPAETG